MKTCMGQRGNLLILDLEREGSLYVQVAVVCLNTPQIFSEHILYAMLSSCTKNTVLNKITKISVLVELTF